MGDDDVQVLRPCSRENDWEQFQDPKPLILALVGEAGELAELFQEIPAAGAVEHLAEPARKQRAADPLPLLLAVGVAAGTTNLAVPAPLAAYARSS